MKNFTTLLLLIVATALAGCVNRIDIPEDENSMLFIRLEMLKGENEIIAEFSTTDNLNGSFPITTPNDAEIVVKEIKPKGLDADSEIIFHFDPDLGKYISAHETNNKFLKHGTSYELTAKIENTGFEEISSTTTVPYPIVVENSELISEDTFQDVDGNVFWQGKVGLTFQPIKDRNENFGQLQLLGQRTLKTISSSGEPEYQFLGGKEYFELIDVVTGNGAITDIIHRDGFFIELSELEDNYVELLLRSPFPITSENQVTDFIYYNLISASKEHYNYHIALNNIRRNEGNIFDENALYSSNIEKGFGLFSSCVEVKDMILLR